MTAAQEIDFDTCTVREWLEHVGRPKYQRYMGKSAQLLNRAAREDVNLFPASWYMQSCDFGRDNGVPVPPHLFRWERKAPGKQNEYSDATVQVQATEKAGEASA